MYITTYFLTKKNSKLLLGFWRIEDGNVQASLDSKDDCLCFTSLCLERYDEAVAAYKRTGF